MSHQSGRHLIIKRKNLDINQGKASAASTLTAAALSSHSPQEHVEQLTLKNNADPEGQTLLP
jgi:hypothetical protein